MKTHIKMLLSVILLLALLICSVGCRRGKEELSGGTSGSDIESGNREDSALPTDYACVIEMKINPEFSLYLDADLDVVAVRAKNDDAKKVIAKALTETTSDTEGDASMMSGTFEEVVEGILSAADEEGFIGDNTIVTLGLAELKDMSLNSTSLLDSALSSAKDSADKLDLSLTFEIKGEQNGDSENGEESSTEGVTDTTPSETEETVTDAPHTHSYSAATCTEPARCSCGATSGSAVGHSWKAASCLSPKSCTVCGATEGGVGSHSISDGVCTVCGHTDSLNPKESLKNNVEYIGYFREAESMLHASALSFDGEACVMTDRFFSPTQSDPGQMAISFNGKNYYSEGGGFMPFRYTLTDTEVIVTNSLYDEADNGEAQIKATLLSNGMLKITYSTLAEYPVGTLLSTNMQDVL